MKMPFEMIVSALRTTGATVENVAAINQELRTLGQPLYRKVEPTGYYPFAEEWTNSAALLSRMNFGLQLARNKVRGVRVDLEKLAGIPAGGNREHQAGLMLGGPEFQRR
jgi:uncharacterized protein (DUF1800 family)